MKLRHLDLGVHTRAISNVHAVLDHDHPRDDETQAVWALACDPPHEFPPKVLHESCQDRPVQLLATD